MNLFPSRQGVLVESEQGQAFFRFWTGTGALFIYFILAALSRWAAPLLVALTCVFAYVVYAYLWLWVVATEKGQRAARQWAAVVLDQVVFSVCFAFGGPPAAALAWVPVTTSVGHGLRFGERRGTIAAIAGSVAIFDAAMLGPAWHAPLSVAVGMGASALIVPLYVVRLVRTMSMQRREAERRAQVLAEVVRFDTLTGVLSRAGFDDAIRNLQELAKTTNEFIGLVYLDLDGFKAINDTNGHDFGDMVLKEVAKALVSVVRGSDAVARLGGDEFVVVVKAPASEEAVARVAHKAVEAIRSLPDEVKGGLPLDASTGIAVLEPGCSVNEALVTADKRMFEVKRVGKERRRSQALGVEIAR
jgi:diguanylate cyclase (GGDEF)-like protein